jgi:checkpoint serine/threonine-protein kinase
MASPSTPATTRQNPIDPTKTPIIDGTLLEVHKENIAPTREGRSAAALSQIFSVSRVQRANDLAASHAYYKRLISDAQDDDEDPLDAYVQYVKWTVDNYPCGRSTESGLLKLLEEATRKFKDDPMYQTDVRYCKLWRQYATHVEQPERIYGFMLANDIGTALAWVYEEYAIALERNGKLVCSYTSDCFFR